MSDQELRATADKMIAMLDRLAEIERFKRDLPIGSAGLVALAEEAEQLARLAFRWSQLQLQQAQSAARRPDQQAPGTMAQVEPRRLDRILADWREAQLRLEIAPMGSSEAHQAADDVERLREEFRAAQEEVR